MRSNKWSKRRVMKRESEKGRKERNGDGKRGKISKIKREVERNNLKREKQ
jgi:hypothetical protein